VSAGAAAGMQQIVITNDVRRWIREECKGITRLLAQILGNSRLIHADRYRADALRFKLRKLFLYAS